MKQRIPVTTRALIQRINRKLAADGQKLRATRGQVQSERGDFYRVDTRRNIVIGYPDIESLGRELKVLQEYEELVKD